MSGARMHFPQFLNVAALGMPLLSWRFQYSGTMGPCRWMCPAVPRMNYWFGKVRRPGGLGRGVLDARAPSRRRVVVGS